MFKQIILAAAAAVTLASLAGCATGAAATGSSASAEQAVAAAAEKLRVAMIDPTPAALTVRVPSVAKPAPSRIVVGASSGSAWYGVFIQPSTASASDHGPQNRTWCV